MKEHDNIIALLGRPNKSYILDGKLNIWYIVGIADDTCTDCDTPNGFSYIFDMETKLLFTPDWLQKKLDDQD